MYERKKIRQPQENLEEMIAELKVGDGAIVDSATGYEIVKVPSGYLYRNEFCGIVFVPENVEAVGSIKNSIAKTEPKKAVTK